MDWNKELKNSIQQNIRSLDVKNSGNYGKTMDDFIKKYPNSTIEDYKGIKSVTVAKNMNRYGVSGRGTVTVNFRKNGEIDSYYY